MRPPTLPGTLSTWRDIGRPSAATGHLLPADLQAAKDSVCKYWQRSHCLPTPGSTDGPVQAVASAARAAGRSGVAPEIAASSDQ